MNLEPKRTLVISGWQLGFNKVAFTKMLKTELDLSLSDAKAITDSILDGRPEELPIGDRESERIAKRASDLGAVVLGPSEESPCR